MLDNFVSSGYNVDSYFFKKLTRVDNIESTNTNWQWYSQKEPQMLAKIKHFFDFATTAIKPKPYRR